MIKHFESTCRMKISSRKHRKNGCSRNGRKNTMMGGVLTSQWTVGERIPDVNNYAQINKSFTTCDYKAPAINVSPAGLPGFSAVDTMTKPWWNIFGGKRATRKSKKMNGGGGGLAYGNAFEMQGPNPVTIQTRLGCESGVQGPMAPTPIMDTGILSKLKFWGGKDRKTRKTRKTRKDRKTMQGGSAPLTGAFDIMDVRGSPLSLGPNNGLVYDAPRAGFSTDAPVVQTGIPPYELHNAYDSKPILAGPCIKGGKRNTRKTRKTKKLTNKRKH